MTEAQVWYCIIAGSIILAFLRYRVVKWDSKDCEHCKKKAKEMLDE